MKTQELVTLALRVLAVFIASQAFVYLAQDAAFWLAPPESYNGPSLTALAVAALLGPFIAAIVLWIVAPNLSRLATRGMSNQPIAGFDAQSVIHATFIAAGTLIFILALPSLARNIAGLLGPPAQFYMPAFVSNILQCLLGVALVVGSRTTSRFLLRLRYAGAGVQNL